ncbi:hypothetical protein LguiA_030750 [Lonicera macranthoides]
MSSSVSHLIYTNPLLLILFVALLLNVTLATTNYQGNETDSLALLAFKSNLHDPQGVLNSWNSSVHICQWQGITCGLRHRRVTVLNLSSSGLVGSLSPNIGNLSFLRSIALKNNSLQGQIPPEIGRLFRLQNLILYNNSLEGEIPANLSHCTNLMVITIANNKLVGEIPRELTTLSNLFFLSLSKNYLRGEIWSSFGNLTYLDTLSLAYNALEGSIPDTFGQLMKLSFLGIAVNEISGMVPSSIYNLSSLTVLSLGLNQIRGSIPHNVGLSLPYLEEFDLESNQFTGAIPTSLTNVSDLASLQLSENNFTGKIPTNFGSLQNLQVLLMHSNFLGNEEDDDMDFLNSLTNCSQLEELEASDNQLGGVFPNSLGNLSTRMRHFGVGMNQISGVIPSGVGCLFNLEILDMTQNQFKGEIPDVMGGSLLLVASVVSLFIIYWLKKKKLGQSSRFFPMKSFLTVSYGDLLKATDGFISTNLIGVGSFGSIYKGILDREEKMVAVKVLNLQRQGASKSFMDECEALRNIRHRNLVKIITSCSSIGFQGNDFKALIYEFMPNGSLERWLNSSQDTDNGQDEHRILNLHQRINIAMDVACALKYLHFHCEKPIVHCDLKPSNILLDRDMVAQVGDFGLAKFLLLELSNANQCSSNGIRGTVGYIAPEYGLEGEVSVNGDVYSYGILLLEMMIGRSPIDPMFNGGLNLHNFAKMALPNHVKEIVESKLLSNIEEEVETATSNNNQSRGQSRNGNRKEDCLISMVKIGVACSMESPQDRMDLNQVVRELYSIKSILGGA